jgi:hypothetical protein
MKIIEHAKAGETNPNRLCSRVVLELGNQPKSTMTHKAEYGTVRLYLMPSRASSSAMSAWIAFAAAMSALAPARSFFFSLARPRP